jgi:hypothetical protein
MRPLWKLVHNNTESLSVSSRKKRNSRSDGKGNQLAAVKLDLSPGTNGSFIAG